MKKIFSAILAIYILILTGCAIFEPTEEFDISTLPPTAAGGDITVTTVESFIASSADDAEQNARGGISLTSSDLELSVDKGNQQVIGLRFKLDIPQGARITDATIQFTSDEVTTGAASLQIYSEATDNAAAYANTSNNISNRPTTASSVSWSPGDWNSVGSADAAQRTPSLEIITQEVISRSGWNSGNYIAYTITGTGTRTAESYNGVATSAPKLVVSYTLEAEAPPPTEAEIISVTTQVSQSSDDAEEGPTGSMYVTSSDLELTTDKGKGEQQVVGLRFKLDIPQGAKIEDANIQFTVKETTDGIADLDIYAEASDDSNTFSTTRNDITARDRTTAKVNWTPPDWLETNSATADQQTPSLAAVTQEVISRSGWSNGNHISYIITGTGTRNARSFNSGTTGAPVLSVSYTLPVLQEGYIYNGNAYPALEKTIYDQGYRDGFMGVDEDGDGLPDSWEIAYGLDPADPTDANNTDIDADGDLLTALEEFLLVTDPNNSDTDGDGLPDSYELVYGLSPTDSGDALLDSDGDGYSNLVEYIEGSDPESKTSTPVIVEPEPTTYTLNLSWTSPLVREDGSTLTTADISSYIVYYGSSASSPDMEINLSDPTQQSYTVYGLDAGTYYFTITAIDTNGLESKPSQTVEITVP